MQKKVGVAAVVGSREKDKRPTLNLADFIVTLRTGKQTVAAEFYSDWYLGNFNIQPRTKENKNEGNESRELTFAALPAFPVPLRVSIVVIKLQKHSKIHSNNFSTI